MTVPAADNNCAQPICTNGHFSLRGKSLFHWIETNEVVTLFHRVLPPAEVRQLCNACREP